MTNWPKHFALHCDEYLCHYLKVIYIVWDKITLGSLAIRMKVEVQTVRWLQLRAPFASKLDRHYISQSMDDGALFPRLTDSSLRESVKHALLRLEVIIPTIESFHENIKLFRIGVTILKTHIIGAKIKRGQTIYNALHSDWSRGGVRLGVRRAMAQALIQDSSEPLYYSNQSIHSIQGPTVQQEELAIFLL
jgi:hypothetical protein